MANQRVEYRDGVPYFEGMSFVSFDEYKGNKQAFENYYTALKYRYEMGIADAEEYYQMLEALRDRYLTKGSDLWWKYSAEIVEYENAAAKEQERLAQEELELKERTVAAIEKVEDDYYSRLDQKRSAYAQKLKSDCTELYAWHERHLSKGEGTFAVMELTDYSRQIDKLEKYKALLDEFTSRVNPSEDLMSDIYSMDIDSAIEFLTLADRTTDSRLNEYIDTRQKYIDLCNEISQSQITELDADEVEPLAEKLESSLKKLGFELPDDFLGSLGADGSDFADGLAQLIERVNGAESVRSALAEGFDVSDEASAEGEAAGQSFIDGAISAITAKRIELQKLMSELFKSSVSGSESGGNTINTTNNTFTIGSGKDTVHEQIAQWRAEMELDQMRSN